MLRVSRPLRPSRARFACLLAALIGVPLTGVNAFAGEEGSSSLPQKTGGSDQRECQGDLEQRFLRLDLSYFLVYPRVSFWKGRAEIASGGLSLVPNDAVRGSDEGMRHASHARAYHWAALASGLAAVGLAAGAYGVHSHEGAWTRPAEALAGGAVVMVVVGFTFAYVRQLELMEAVNSYNYDVVRNRLRE